MLYKRLSIWNSIQEGFQKLSQGPTDQTQSGQDFKIFQILFQNISDQCQTNFENLWPIRTDWSPDLTVRRSLVIVAVEISRI